MNYTQALNLSHRIAVLIGNPSEWGACPPDPLATLNKALILLNAL
jgi:hypothetical protein